MRALLLAAAAAFLLVGCPGKEDPVTPPEDPGAGAAAAGAEAGEAAGLALEGREPLERAMLAGGLGVLPVLLEELEVEGDGAQGVLDLVGEARGQCDDVGPGIRGIRGE